MHCELDTGKVSFQLANWRWRTNTVCRNVAGVKSLHSLKRANCALSTSRAGIATASFRDRNSDIVQGAVSIRPVLLHIDLEIVGAFVCTRRDAGIVVA